MLVSPTDRDLDELMSWFSDAQSVDIWGGPNFRYPFSRESFVEDCRFEVMQSFILRDPERRVAAFGQYYNRHDRGHLARLIANPAMRRRGVGKRLITMLIQVAREQHGFSECSLFVYRDNEPAYHCYLALGFTVQDYPDDAPMEERCYFLTRSSDLNEV